MNEISMVISSVKTALESAKVIMGLSKEVAVKEKAQELFNIIDSLRERINNLESLLSESKRIAEEWKQKALEKDTWDQTIKSYTTYEPTPGVRVYIQKALSDLPEQAEWYCKHCADVESAQSTFQMIHHSAAGKDFQCHKCIFKFHIPEPRPSGGSQIKMRPFI